MVRLLWGLGATVTALLGWWLLVVDLGGWTGYLFVGVGIGIGTSVIGSLAHDLLTRSP